MNRPTIEISSPKFGLEVQYAVWRVLRSGEVVQGAQVAEFEREYADIIGVKECVAVNSGTSALHLGLLAAGIGPGDEVIVPSFSFAASANAVALTGASPVFVDIDPKTYCIDPEAVAESITSRTRGILPVHLYGNPAAMGALLKISKRHGIPIFEDCAQAHLAESIGRKVGSIGLWGAFSLYATKNLTSIEGGLLTTNDQEIARKVRLLRNQGMLEKYRNEIVGFNNRMTDLQAAIGRVLLRRLPHDTEKRIRNAGFISNGLPIGVLPRVRPNDKHVFNQFTLRVTNGRDQVARELKGKLGVATAVYYPTPIHKLPPFATDRHRARLVETERACEEVLSIPIHANLTKNNLKKIRSGLLALLTKDL